MEYKVVAFVAQVDSKKGNSNHVVADQLDVLIKSYGNSGWKYLRLESVTTFVHPNSGCFGLGAQSGYTTTNQMAVFKK